MAAKDGKDAKASGEGHSSSSVPSAADQLKKMQRWKLWKWRKPTTTKEKIEHTMENSLAASKHILSLCHELNQMGVEVNQALEVHLESLDRIERMMEEINESMRAAEVNLVQMEKCCGLFTLPWKRNADYEQTDDYIDTWQRKSDPLESANIIGPPDFVNTAACRHPGIPPTGEFFDSIIASDPREAQIEANLQEASKMLVSIRRRVIDAGAELELQGRYLPIVAMKALSLEKRVKLGTTRANVILEGETDSKEIGVPGIV